MKKILIQTRERLFCPACNSVGKFLYSLEDKFFCTNNDRWAIKICDNKECGTLWLDPSPLEAEIIKLYGNYPTHTKSGVHLINKDKSGGLLERIRSSYLYKVYGYENNFSGFVNKYLWLFAYLHPAWLESQIVNMFYFPANYNGRLLDVGCGSGNSLQKMKENGWSVCGIDFDEDAVKNAKSKGLEVYIGDLFSQNFLSESYDAILLSHVIEHVPDPIKLLKECQRILKKGGRLVVITPNANSRGHLKFGKNWRGLEVPTHLQILTVNSLKKIATDIGFSAIKSQSSLQGFFYIAESSAQMKKNNTFELEIKPSFFRRFFKVFIFFIAGWRRLFFPDRDDVAVLICDK